MYNFVKGIPKPNVEEIGRTYTDHGESTFESRHRVLGGKNPPKLDGLAPYAIVGYAMVEDYITYMDVDPNETTRETLERSLSILPGAKFKKVKNAKTAMEKADTATNFVQGGQKVKNVTDLEQSELEQLEEHIKKLDKDTGRVVSDLDKMKSLIKNGKIQGNNIISKIDDNTQVIFRKDTGGNAHPIKPKYPNAVDHYNVEIQTKTSAVKWKSRESYHIIVDKNGNVIDRF